MPGLEVNLLRAAHIALELEEAFVGPVGMEHVGAGVAEVHPEDAGHSLFRGIGLFDYLLRFAQHQFINIKSSSQPISLLAYDLNRFKNYASFCDGLAN